MDSQGNAAGWLEAFAVPEPLAPVPPPPQPDAEPEGEGDPPAPAPGPEPPAPREIRCDRTRTCAHCRFKRLNPVSPWYIPAEYGWQPGAKVEPPPGPELGAAERKPAPLWVGMGKRLKPVGVTG